MPQIFQTNDIFPTYLPPPIPHRYPKPTTSFPHIPNLSGKKIFAYACEGERERHGGLVGAGLNIGSEHE